MQNDQWHAADRVFFGGPVVTVNRNDETASALAVKGNRIVYVGDEPGLSHFTGDATVKIDLKGRSLTPGFIDSHYHPILNGLLGPVIIDVFYPAVTSIAQIKEIVREQALRAGKGRWVYVWGYDVNKVEERRHVTIEDLDEAAPDNPVQCLQASGHIIAYNTKAFEAAGIYGPQDASRFGPGELEVKNGKLTGLTYDMCAFYLWSKITYNDDEVDMALKKSHDKLLRYGITSIHDPGEFGASSYGAMQQRCNARTFKPRSYMMLHSVYGKPYSRAEVGHFLALGLRTGLGNDYFKIGPCKFMVDGGTCGPSAAMRQPYCHDAGDSGVLSFTQEEVTDMLRLINTAGCQGTAHAVGDRAVEMMLGGYKAALAEHPRKPEEHRHRIEHCGFVDEKMIAQIKELGVIPIVNSPFITRHGRNFNKFYGERVNYYAALRSFIDAGIIAAIASDAPTVDENPMRGIDAAVNRRDWVYGDLVGPCQSITVKEALRCYTWNAAYAAFEEKTKGSLEPGKLADLVVLDRDILAGAPGKVSETLVDMTMIDGEIVYERKV